MITTDYVDYYDENHLDISVQLGNDENGKIRFRNGCTIIVCVRRRLQCDPPQPFLFMNETTRALHMSALHITTYLKVGQYCVGVESDKEKKRVRRTSKMFTFDCGAGTLLYYG